MNTFDDQDDTDDRLETQREIIRESLNEIANDVGMMLCDVGLTFPVYITVRHARASEIVRQTIAKKIGSDRLTGRELPCAMANAPPMSVAEVTAG